MHQVLLWNFHYGWDTLSDSATGTFIVIGTSIAGVVETASMTGAVETASMPGIVETASMPGIMEAASMAAMVAVSVRIPSRLGQWEGAIARSPSG
jgi:hypothetical protein